MISCRFVWTANSIGPNQDTDDLRGRLSIGWKVDPLILRERNPSPFLERLMRSALRHRCLMRAEQAPALTDGVRITGMMGA